MRSRIVQPFTGASSHRTRGVHGMFPFRTQEAERESVDIVEANALRAELTERGDVRGMALLESVLGE